MDIAIRVPNARECANLRRTERILDFSPPSFDHIRPELYWLHDGRHLFDWAKDAPMLREHKETMLQSFWTRIVTFSHSEQSPLMHELRLQVLRAIALIDGSTWPLLHYIVRHDKGFTHKLRAVLIYLSGSASTTLEERFFVPRVP